MTEPTPKSLQQPGDVRVNKLLLSRTVDGTLLDLMPFMVEINIYEDIFTPALYGNIVIRDTRNIVGQFPIVGDEVVFLDIETPGLSSTSTKHDPINKIEKAFAVYAVKNRMVFEDKEQHYILHFCSLEAVYDNTTKISKKYSGTTDDIIYQIWEENLRLPRYFTENLAENNTDQDHKNTLVIGDTPHQSKISFVSPMWSPIECINWLTKRSIGNKRKSPSFLFYETTKGYYCASLEDLIATQLESDEIISEYFFNTHIQERNLKKDFSNVEDVKFKTNLDIMQSQDLGHFTSSIYTYDLIKKEDALYYYDHSFGFKDYVHMESYKKEGNSVVNDDTKTYNMLFPFNVLRSANTKPILATLNPGVLDSTEDSIDLHPDTFVSQRLSSLMDINTLKLDITVPGRTDMEVGRLIRFWYPSVGQQSAPEEIKYDVFISGIFMVTAIHHQITQFRHTMTMEIAKDSYANPILDVTLDKDTKSSFLVVPGGEGSSAPASNNTAQNSSPSTTPAPGQGAPAQTSNTGAGMPVDGGSFVGDSIAVKLGSSAAGQKTVNATVGYSTEKILSSYRGKGGKKYTVLSMGTNDWGTGSWSQTEKNIRDMRASITSPKVIWIVPNTNLVSGKNDKQINGMRKAADLVRKIAGSDPVIELTSYKCSDGLHPDSSEVTKINNKITQLVG